MYFPYLRGKQYDLIAIRETTPIIKASKIIPIIEPMNDSLSSYREFNKQELRYIFIVNPEHGDLVDSPESLSELTTFVSANPKMIFGYLITRHSTLSEIKNFFDAYQGKPIALLHKMEFKSRDELADLCARQANIVFQIFLRTDLRSGYIEKFRQSDTILIEDGFNRNGVSRNADYEEEVYFSELHNTFSSLGHSGFGDYLTVGEPFREGWTPFAVAIHLTYLNPRENNEVWVRHFVSDRREDQSDTPGKFLEAVAKLTEFLNTNPSAFLSEAAKEFIDLHNRGHYPGLGTLKGLSQRHHIELMAKIIR